jgi:hypothetical protein
MTFVLHDVPTDVMNTLARGGIRLFSAFTVE